LKFTKILNNKIHIVSFDVPSPPDYGGVIDIYFKIKSLFKIGLEIYLHIFKYGREEDKELNKYCKKVYYYERTSSYLNILSTLPYIVISRKNNELIKNLILLNAPILFEGLHTTYAMRNKEILKRKIFVRTHNIEHDYYKSLAKTEKKLFKKIYLLLEAIKLKSYEKILNKSTIILSISKKENDYFKNKYKSNTIYIPAFHSNSKVKNLSKKGYFAFYHGNLSVSDNIKAVEFLIDIFKTIDYPLVIAGKIEKSKFQSQINKIKNISFIQLENEKHLLDLLSRAHINVLLSFQKTGIKLKLINSLFNSRFCVVNQNIIEGTKLDDLCFVGKNKLDFKRQIIQLINTEYLEEEIIKRDRLLQEFNNVKNAKKIYQLLDN